MNRFSHSGEDLVNSIRADLYFLDVRIVRQCGGYRLASAKAAAEMARCASWTADVGNKKPKMKCQTENTSIK